MARARPFNPDRIPAPPSRALALRLRAPGERAVREGHPWVYEGSVRSVDASGPPPAAGDVGVVFDRKGRFLAAGLYDPDDAVRLRILASGTPTRVGQALVAQRLEHALRQRIPLSQAENGESGDGRVTDGFRVVNGEGDGLPGVVLDRYGDTAVLKLYSAAWLPRLRELVPAVVDVLAPTSLLALVSRRVAAHPLCPSELRIGALLHGPDPGPALPFRENGVRLEAHPLEGHKTGFYLDQRDNRGRVEEEARRLAGERGSLRALNVFSYSGGFSLYAARGGLAGVQASSDGGVEVVSVDAAGPALRQAERHFALNEVEVGEAVHRTVEGDAFQVMDRMARDGGRFHLIILDPPSFAMRKEQRDGALAAYGRLTRAALPLLEPGGTLVQASCSSRVESEAFYRVVRRRVLESGRRWENESRWGHALDHPIGPPEGEYLKCLFMTVN